MVLFASERWMDIPFLHVIVAHETVILQTGQDRDLSPDMNRWIQFDELPWAIDITKSELNPKPRLLIWSDSAIDFPLLSVFHVMS